MVLKGSPIVCVQLTLGLALVGGGRKVEVRRDEREEERKERKGRNMRLA